MFNLKKLLIFIIFIGFSLMSNAKIKFYTSSYPNFYGDSLKEIMWIDGEKEFFVLNANSYNNDLKNLDGIGLVEGELDKVTAEKYKEIRNNIFKLNNKNHEKYEKVLKPKKLNAYSLEGDKEYKSFIIYQSNRDEEKEIIDWFKAKSFNFITDKKYALKTGFLIESVVEEKDKFYNVKVIIKNISTSKITLSGVNDWQIRNDSKKKMPEVIFRLKNDWTVFNFNLCAENFVKKEKNDLERITLEPKSDKILEFLIPKNKFDNVNKYLIAHPTVKFESNLILNLDIYEPSLISGGFYYSTKLKKFN